MDRRSALKGLFGVGGFAGAVTPKTVPARQWPTWDRPLNYQGYLAHWTGWKSHTDSAMQFGQWLAWPMKGFGQRDFPDRQPYLYVAVPGMIGGAYFAGACFNITTFDDRVVDAATPVETRDTYVAQAESYIRRLVDVLGPCSSRQAWHYGGRLDREETWRDIQRAIDEPAPAYKFGFSEFKRL